MKAVDKNPALKQAVSASRSKKLAAAAGARHDNEQVKKSTTVKSTVPAGINQKTLRTSRDLKDSKTTAKTATKTAAAKNVKKDTGQTELNRTYKKEDLKKAVAVKQSEPAYYEDYASDFESDDEVEKSSEKKLGSINAKDENLNRKKIGGEVTNQDVKTETTTGNGQPDLSTANTTSTTKIKRTERPETSQVAKIRTTIELQNDLVYRPNRAKELLDIISLNTAVFEIVNVEPIDYKEFMKDFGQINTKQVGIQSIERKDAEVQLEIQSTLDHKSTQTSAELGGASQENHYNYSIDELFRLKKFLFKAESILNQLLLARNRSNEIDQSECKRFGRLFRLDCQFNQLITFHEFYGYDSSGPKSSAALSNTLAVFWCQNRINQLLYCREKISSNLAIEAGLYVLATQNGTLLIYDLTDRNPIKSNLNLPDLKIAGVDKSRMVSSSFSTLFLPENQHKSKIVKLSSLQSDENFKKTTKLFSLDEAGNLLIWGLEKVKNQNLSLDCKLGKGMSPLSKFKLTLYESLSLTNILSSRDFKLADGYTFSTFEKATNPVGSFDYLLPALDQSGQLWVQHFKNNTTLKKSFRLPINLSNTVLSIDFCSADPTLFLVVSSDGIVTLFDLEIVQPLYVWQLQPGIVKASWLNCEGHRCFMVLDSSNRILVYDLNHEPLHQPVQTIASDVK